MSEQIEQLFPNLVDMGYSITSPQDIRYNCIAWAAGHSNKWWWPDPMNIAYWPPSIPRSITLEAFISMFESLGYNSCESTEYEDGFEKIALYTMPDGKPTHVARQLPSGLWASKLGQLEDIEHHINGFEGSRYGSVAVIMKKPN